MAGKSDIIEDALRAAMRALSEQDASRLSRTGSDPAKFLPYTSNYRRTETSFYDPQYWSVTQDHLEYPDGTIVGTKDKLVPIEPTRRIEEVLKADPELMYRGMSAEELANFLRSGEIRSNGSYNMTGQEGLTYFTSDPDSGQYYANSFAPEGHKPNMDRPAYVVAAKRPPTSNVIHVPGVADHEIGVNRATPVDDVVNIYRGTTTDFSPGLKEKGLYVAPRASLNWEGKSLEDVLKGRANGGSVREGYADKGAVTDPYADEVARAKALMAEKRYDEQPWGDWAGDAVGNALNTAKAILPTALGGEGSVGISDMARGAYEGAKDAVTFPGDVISGKQPLYDESGRPLESAVGRSFNTVGAVGGASSLVPVPDNSLRVFGGIKSKTADKNALTKAQIMESQGGYYDPNGSFTLTGGNARDDIWRQSGWGRGAEGGWRYEIPDVGTTVDPTKFQLDLSSATIPSGMKTTLSEYINHPELFDAYPEFKNMVVKGYYGDPSDTVNGYYMPRSNRGTINPGFNEPYIALNLNNVRTLAEQRRTLLHEIQHAIQQKEGFVPGTNQRSRPLETPNPRYATYMDALNNDPEMKELQSLFESDEYKAGKAAKALLFAEYTKIVNELDAKEATTGVSTKNEYVDATNDYFLKVSGKFPLSQKAAQIGFSLEDRGIPSTEPPKFLDQIGAYLADAGETEARNVQARKDGPREELKERAPWRTQEKNLPYEAQLIDWNDTSWRKGYATQGAVEPGPVFIEDAKGTRYDTAGNIIPPAQDPVTDALSVARRETVDPYAEEVASAKKIMADQQYQNQSWGDWAGDVGKNLYETGMSFLPTTLGGRGEVGLTDIAKGAYESAKSGITLPGDVLAGRTNVFDPATGKLTDEVLRRGADFTGLVTMAPASIPADANTLRMGMKGPPTPGDAEAAALKAAQEAAGGDQVAAATRAAQIEALNPVPPPQGIAPPTNALQTERAARTVISPTSIKLTPQEQAVVNSFKSRADRAIVASRIRETKARYPKSDGWSPFEAVGAEFDDKGNPVIKWKEQSYGFNTAVQAGNRTVTDPLTGEKTQIQVNEPRGLRPGTPQYESQARKATRNGVKEVEDIIRRAGEGDENALRIIRQAGWYREFMRKGFDERGGSYPAFSDLLGATSPNTAVDQNYRYSVDIQNRFARGDFDRETAFARDYQGSLNNFPEDKLIYRNPVGPKGPQKLQYGMNSRNAQMALADKWRTKEQGQAPKARNFSGNLGGATDQATIDVWAARFINRMTGRKRLPPPVESGVKGQLGSNLEPTGEFGFGQDVFRRITDELNRKGNLLPYLQELGYDRLTPMDMQALTWFIEKERWTKNNWTTAAGEGGSFEDELMRYPSERWQSGVSIQQADPPSDAAMASTRNVFENSLRDDPNVNQYRVHPTIGRYAGNNERSFDLELTAKPGWNPQTWMAAVIREAKANNQYDVFFSKRLPPEIAQSNPNARPGVEIYFRDRKTLDQALPILEEFTKRNADGFTFVTDLRLRERELGGKEAPDFVGVRMQWVPEIRMRWDDDFRNAAINDPNALELASDEALDAMQNALNALDKAGLGIVDARLHHYDTLTIGKESYDKFLDGIADPENAIGSYEGGAGAPVDPVKRFGQPIRSHAEGRDRALRTGSEGGQSDAGGDVVGAGQSSGPLTPEQRTANFNTSFGNTVLRTPQGKPMRLYHLTPNDITEFSASPTNRAGPVVYLSPYPEFQPAHHQAGVTGERGEFTGAFREGANVMPVYADVRNPLVLDHPRKIKEAAAKYQKGDREFPRYVSPEAKAAMEADGYDAIIFGGENPIPYGDRPMDARLGHQEARDEEFIIFDPKKIKSATGNRGTYDMTTPNITKAEGGSVEGEDGWFDAAMTIARNAADKATFGTSKYAAAGADYLTDAALDAVGYENDADFDRALAEQKYAMKEGEEKNPAAAGAGDVLGYVAPYLAIGPAEGALSTLGYLSDYGSKIGRTGSLFARALGYADGGEVDDDIYHAVRLSRDLGGATNENPQVMMTDANGVQYDSTGKVIQTADPQANSNSSAALSPTTPEEVGRRAAEDPATFDAMMERYAVPDRDIVDYEALKKEVSQQPQQVQQMTHVGAPPMRDIKVDMPLFGGEYNAGQAPYDIANPMSGVAQTAYDWKTAPLYLSPWTAPIGAGMDVAEGVATGDPLTASLAMAFGPGGKMAKAAGIGAANYFIDPSEAEAGPARWFSKAMEVASALPMEKMTGQQALAMLRKGTSPEELKWTGAENFLSSRPQVSKSELVDYLSKNRVQVNEVSLGGGRPTNLDDISIHDVPDDIKSKYMPEINSMNSEVGALAIKMDEMRRSKNPNATYSEEFDDLSRRYSSATAEFMRKKNAMKQEYADSIGGLARPTKYQDYSTVGGEGYTERLYTLGNKPKYTVGKSDGGLWSVLDESGNVLKTAEGKPYSYWSEDNANSAAKSLYRDSGKYRSGHWDDPDVMFHTRSQTLSYDPPGSNRPYRVHNVDETQSDWGRGIRKYGMKDPTTNWRDKYFETAKGMTDEWVDQKAKAAFDAAPQYYDNDMSKALRWARDVANVKGASKIAQDLGRHQEYLDAYNKMNREGDALPAGPFVSGTEGWTDRSIKQELDKALDSDADYFSWSPGEVHADRYDLSKHIGRIDYNPDDGSFLAYNPDGKMVINESINDPGDLDNYVGKELADKIRAEEESRRYLYNEYSIDKNDETGKWEISLYGEPSYDSYGELSFVSKGDAKDRLNQMMADEFAQNPVSLSGLDLKVGGEGMKGYYDKVYLKRVQDVIKKATGTKPEIEVIEVQTGDGPRKQLGVKLTDEMREKARFSDFNRGGTVTAPSSYGNDDPAVSRAIALTREY